MIIERMNVSNVLAIAALEQQCFSDPWSEKSISSELENPLSLWLVATDGKKLLGYVGSQTVLGQTDMMNLAVSPEARRQGVGRSLVLALIEELKKQGSQSLMLEVRISNTPARSLYESLGFIPAGRRPRYYVNPREDALILRKEWSV